MDGPGPAPDDVLRSLPPKLYATVKSIFDAWDDRFLTGTLGFGVVPYGYNPGRTQAYSPPPPLWNQRVYADLMYVCRGIGLISEAIDSLVSYEPQPDNVLKPGTLVYGTWFSLEEVRNDWYQCAPYVAMLNRQLWQALADLALDEMAPGDALPDIPSTCSPTSDDSVVERAASIRQSLARIAPAAPRDLGTIATETASAELAAVRAHTCILGLADLSVEPDIDGLRVVIALTQTAELAMSEFLHRSLKIHAAWRALDLTISLES